MSKQLQDAYIVAATRTPIGKAPRGMFNKTRPDDLLVAAIKGAMAAVPGLDPALIVDAIIGCSFPEAEQGFNIARNSGSVSGVEPTTLFKYNVCILASNFSSVSLSSIGAVDGDWPSA